MSVNDNFRPVVDALQNKDIVIEGQKKAIDLLFNSNIGHINDIAKFTKAFKEILEEGKKGDTIETSFITKKLTAVLSEMPKEATMLVEKPLFEKLVIKEARMTSIFYPLILAAKEGPVITINSQWLLDQLEELE